MTAVQFLLTIVCVLAICTGQLLFKKVGLEIQVMGSWFQYKVFWLGGIAGLIYGGATLLWIHLLRTIDLNQIYPFMALSFVVVPLMSWLMFDERLSGGYLLGASLIMVGLVLIVSAR